MVINVHGGAIHGFRFSVPRAFSSIGILKGPVRRRRTRCVRERRTLAGASGARRVTPSVGIGSGSTICRETEHNLFVERTKWHPRHTRIQRVFAKPLHVQDDKARMSWHDESGQVGIWEDVCCDNTGYGMSCEEPVSEILGALKGVDAIVQGWNLDRSEKECLVKGDENKRY